MVGFAAIATAMITTASIVTSPATAATTTTVPSTQSVSAAVSVVASDHRITEWRRVDTSNLSPMITSAKKWAAAGGTAVVLDLSFMVDQAEQQLPTAKPDKKLSTYVASLQTLGLRVDATAGSAHWYAHTYIPALLAKRLNTYNRRYPDQAITSITYDVEPWSLPQFLTSPETVTATWLDFTAEALASHPGMQVGVFVPYWMDGRAHIPSMTYHGHTATPAVLLAELVAGSPGGFISVMDYQDTVDRMFAGMAVWSELGVPVRAAVCIGPSDPGSTWFGLPWTDTVAAMTALDSHMSSTGNYVGLDVDSIGFLPTMQQIRSVQPLS